MTARRLVAAADPVVLVCGDCCVALERLGGAVDRTPRSVSPGHPCEAHEPRTRHLAQAMHAVRAPAKIMARLSAMQQETQPEALEGADEDWREVAHLAGALAVGSGEPLSEDLLVVSVVQARRLVALSKGGR